MWLYRTHVHFNLKGSDCTIVAFEVGVENIVKLVEKVPEFSFLVVRSMLSGSTWTRSEWRLWNIVTSDFGVYAFDTEGISRTCVVLTLQKV